MVGYLTKIVVPQSLSGTKIVVSLDVKIENEYYKDIIF